MADRIENLADFVAFVNANIKGSEKSEAQTFLDRFFQAFGHGGVDEYGKYYIESLDLYLGTWYGKKLDQIFHWLLWWGGDDRILYWKADQEETVKQSRNTKR
jgi:hypothetical protein